MPITPDEIPAITTQGAALAKELGEAFSKESDGGKKLTKKELRRLAGLAASFAARVGLDLAD
jgi:hypothetical protein